jgi:DNA (cytosine-5)-methyltransferase 1
MDARVQPRIEPAISTKLLRLARGEVPRVLDLFSGCGGISLGFQKAGFRIDANVEFDELAARSHARNFHGSSPEILARHDKARDITALEPDQLAEELGLGAVEEAIDVLVGGPPCQAYARVGRAKLREVADHPTAYKVDPRRNLYLRYLEYVRAYKPLALLMENVPDILNQAGHNVIEEMVETLSGMGYDAKYSLINTSFHGVPQMRDRVFMIAYRKELHATIRFPRATHYMKLPVGYAGTRAVALKFVDLLGGAGYVQADLGNESLPYPVTAAEAIGDLPFLHGGSVKRGARRFNELARYRETNEISAYAVAMRQWEGFESPNGVMDHVIRYLPRDLKVFAEMRQNAEYPEAHATAVKIAEREAKTLGLEPKTKAYESLYASIVPPYDTTKFPNRWWKLAEDRPVRTLMAHLGKDTYSHIHYDDAQARTISVREGARLQSFPDGFKFAGTMNPAFKQIGNAVPPLMAFCIADIMRNTLQAAAQRNY